MPSKRSYAAKDVKMLWGRSAARCNFPSCRRDCVIPATDHDHASPYIGKLAHIVGSSDDGPRGDADYPKEKLDTYENLILMCSTHHDEVDAQENTYTTDMLRRWKCEHEEWVERTLQTAMVQVGFKELEDVCSFLLSTPCIPESDYRLTDPSVKMQRNGLTNSVRMLLDMGAAKGPTVQSYILSRVEGDYEYPERLKSGFLAEYHRLFTENQRGDELFESLRAFASGGGAQFHRAAAGLAVLCYLFQTCEVFDR